MDLAEDTVEVTDEAHNRISPSVPRNDGCPGAGLLLLMQGLYVSPESQSRRRRMRRGRKILSTSN